MLERFFKLKEHGTTVSTEMLAGLATFLTAAYVLAVNPDILAKTGMPVEALFSATAIAIIIGTMLMALFANLPFILAPGMGINMYFTYSIVLQKGYTWQEALTMVLLAGILFVLTGAFGLREALVRGFPEPLKHAMTVALGLMIATIGLSNAGVVVFKQGFVSLGNITDVHGAPFLTLIGLVITGILVSLNFRGAVLVAIAATTIIGAFTGVTNYQNVIQNGAFSAPPSVAPIAMAFSLDWGRILTFDFGVAIITLLAIDVFDSLGTFVGVFNHFDGEQKRQYESRVPRALMCDAIATVAGACLGTSTVTTYVESSTGIAAGGRTGLTSVTISLLVLAALFASPLFLMIPSAATGPALVVVGMYMMGLSTKIRFNEADEGLPAIIMILVTALTWSISDGLMFGWLGYVIFKLCAGKMKDLNATILLVGVFFLARLIFI